MSAQALRNVLNNSRRQLLRDGRSTSRRTLSVLPSPTSSSSSSSSPSSSSSSNAPLPWFIDPTDTPAISSRLSPSSLPAHPALPASISPTHPLAALHAALSRSPHLEPGTLLVRPPVPTPPGPPLPLQLPRGRRQRGRTYAGEPVAEFDGGVWEWILLAQVKEGTEKRGGIESVVRTVRKVLLTAQPPLLLPHNSKKRMSDSWAMIDAGDFAVHIVSREAREKFFPERREWAA